MKRILALLLFVAISMMGCNFNSSSKATSTKLPKDVTVKHVELTQQEKDIANATGSTVEKFIFEKDKVYDIQVSYYYDGKIIPQQALLGVDSKGKDLPVLISNQSLPNSQNKLWHIGADSGASFCLDFFPKDKSQIAVFDTGKSSFKMEKEKEYVLYYEAHKRGTSISSNEMAIFSNWDSTENKLEQLKNFDYVVLFTTKISDTPGYK
jgi:uncharacterized lipoprotein NlpE involved in copper resistance